jgi:hypothetical protein
MVDLISRKQAETDWRDYKTPVLMRKRIGGGKSRARCGPKKIFANHEISRFGLALNIESAPQRSRFAPVTLKYLGPEGQKLASSVNSAISPIVASSADVGSSASSSPHIGGILFRLKFVADT